MKRLIGAGAVAAACMGSALGAGNDELWEVTTKMNMAGMPAGMGNHTSQVCTEKGDPKKAMMQRGECKITDFNQAGNKITIKVSCPDGSGVIENTYNAAHTEYQGSMKYSGSRGEMTMAMSGRKVGACDAQATRQERETKTAAIRQQSEKMQAQSAAMTAQANAGQIAECRAAVDTMQMQKLGMWGRCDQMSGMCQTMAANEQSKPVATQCMASQVEFCRKYQTLDGFIKANGDEEAAKMCKVSRTELIASSCPRAAQTENLVYLGRFCPSEAKPLAREHCVGRSYTSRVKDKYSDFCSAYLAQNSLDEGSTSGHKIDPKQAMQQGVQGVQQGINKLKGLFGK
jgi:uncharacterized protein DUF3617